MFKRKKHSTANSISSTLPEPQRTPTTPERAQWLAGEGAGSWFYINLINGSYQITRYSPKGEIECQSLFELKSDFDITRNFEVIHLSHCNEVNVLQNNIKHTFRKI